VEYLVSYLEKIGAKTTVVDGKGNPLIVGTLMKSQSAPTVVFYNHYDVQPIAAPDKWNSDPFSLVQDANKWIGRGASDNKGNLLVALKAVESALEKGIDLNFQFIYEGEEEIGSPNLKDCLLTVKEQIVPDVLIVADSSWLRKEQPSVTYGLRGLLYMKWSVKTAERNAHSGIVGGIARNPILELADACSCCAEYLSGKILVPGIYKNVRTPADEEKAGWNKLEFKLEQIMELYGLQSVKKIEDRGIFETIWATPTFDVHGIIGGDMRRDGIMTVIPNAAQAKVSMRLVPDQDPDEILALVKGFLADRNKDIAVEKLSAVKPFVGKYSGVHINAICKALEKNFGLPVAKIRAGGSIGAVPIMQDVLDPKEIVIMGFGLPENSVHGPNENFIKDMALGGITTYSRYFECISK
jgi:acetylornithine deacetylase/succinyl-diaminopimelate desuccinylase-like protein